MSRTAIPSWFFVLAAVRRGDHFLLIRENSHGQNWYLPAGRVELEEDFVSAAQRETFEEAGIPIAVEGIVRIEHSPMPTGTRLRLIVAGCPIDDTPPKSKPDQDSLEARWFTLPEIEQLSLRNPDALQICAYLANGGVIAPITLLGWEGRWV